MDLKGLIGSKKEIVIAGCGNVGGFLLQEIEKLDLDVEIAFCDNNKAKWGTYEGKSVTSYEEATEKYPNAVYFVACVGFIHKMKEQLVSLGIEEKAVYAEEIHDYILELSKKYREEHKLKPMPMLRMEVSLAEHCNLNCKYCAHFSSIAEKEFIDVKQYEKDMNRMSYLLNGKSGVIYLVGGEPLLCEDVNEVCKITRRAFPESRIILLSNGLLINRMPEEFFEVCREESIVVAVTKYPINFDYDKVIERLQKEGLEYDYMRMSDEGCTFNKYVLDLDGKQEAYDSFTNCGMANQCHLVKNGRIYTCSVIGCIEHFNKRFDQNLEVTEDDYVDIYSVKSGEEMLKKLATPAPFCRYCDVHARVENLPFEISKKEISEWV